MEHLNTLWINTGLYQITYGQAIMLLVGLLLLYLAIVKKFEPLLLLPIGFGAVLSNIQLPILRWRVEYSIIFIMLVSAQVFSHY